MKVNGRFGARFVWRRRAADVAETQEHFGRAQDQEI
jgi:hypothetical protein